MRRTKLVFQLSCVALLVLCGCGKNYIAEGSADVSEYIQDSREDIETVVGGSEPEGSDSKDKSIYEKSLDGSVGNERGDTSAKNKTEPLEIKSGVAGEEDRGTSERSQQPDETFGLSDGMVESDSAVSVSSDSDMGRQDEPESELWDEEYSDNAGLGNEDDNSGFESEQSEYSYDSELDESGFIEDAGEYEYDSTDQYGDDSMSEPEVSGKSIETVEEESYDDELTYLGTWTISFYCPCEICCGAYSSGYTASGTLAQPWYTCATDGLEFGSTVYVEGLGYFVVEDRGTAYGWLDIFTGNHSEALSLGLQYGDVYLVN